MHHQTATFCLVPGTAARLCAMMITTAEHDGKKVRAVTLRELFTLLVIFGIVSVLEYFPGWSRHWI
jgi:hypothetical protein